MDTITIIDHYSREQALEDGLLINVSETAKEAGLCFPVAVTRAVWHRCVEVPEIAEGQDEAGRLWDILWMLRCKIAAMRQDNTTLQFQVYVRNDKLPPKLVTLKSVCGPGDKLEPVITVMLPSED